VLEPAVPVLRHIGDVIREYPDHLLDLLRVDDPAQTRPVGVLARDHHRHVVVEDVDGEVVALLSHQVLGLALQDHSCAVMRIDDVVSNLESALDWCLDLEVGYRRLVDYLLCQLRNWSLLCSGSDGLGHQLCKCRSTGSIS
jgi:hypothetical protein